MTLEDIKAPYHFSEQTYHALTLEFALKGNCIEFGVVSIDSAIVV